MKALACGADVAIDHILRYMAKWYVIIAVLQKLHDVGMFN